MPATISHKKSRRDPALLAFIELAAESLRVERNRDKPPVNLRPEQIAPPGEWGTWLIMTGRGWGKTETGSRFAHDKAKEFPLGAIIAPTAKDLRDTMIYGESGILNTAPRGFRPEWVESKNWIVWPNGAKAITYTAEAPDRLRGPNLYWAWWDELAATARRKLEIAYPNLMFTLRRGENPQLCVTTTPRNIDLLKQMIRDPDTVVVRGTTYENRANLSEAYYRRVIKPFEGTRLGRQEIGGEILEDVPGALWTLAELDEIRIPLLGLGYSPMQALPGPLRRVVVGIDPSGGKDEIGIVADGLIGTPQDGTYVILEDRSLIATPAGWANEGIALYRDWQADRLVAESNYGGAMVEATIKAIDRNVPVTMVSASRGKILRAEPVKALGEQGRLKILGSWPLLESEMVTYTGDPDEASPNRLDAMVWGIADLTAGGKKRLRGF